MASGTSPLTGAKETATAAQTAAPARKVGKDLGKDAFLQLLVTQLKNQDPMKPMDDSSFIAEMAQFSSLEQMQNLNKNIESQQHFAALSQASGMIGKYVSLVTDAEKGEVTQGQVSEVRQADGKITVVVGGKEYDATKIDKVTDKPFGDGSPAATSQGIEALAKAAAAALPPA